MLAGMQFVAFQGWAPACAGATSARDYFCATAPAGGSGSGTRLLTAGSDCR